MSAHSGARHQSIVTSMQLLLGVIIWSMSIHKQPCKAACKQPCATQFMHISRSPTPHPPNSHRSTAKQPQECHHSPLPQPPDSTIRTAPHQPSPQPPATSHGTGTSPHPSHQPPAMAPAPRKCPRYYAHSTANSHRPSHQPGPHRTRTAKPRNLNPLLIIESKNPTTQALFGEKSKKSKKYRNLEPSMAPWPE